MKYPRKPIEEHKTYKIFPSEYPVVKEMKKSGMKVKAIALKYGVSPLTIYHILDPEKRKKHNANSVSIAMNRIKTDDEFRKNQANAVASYMKDRKKVDKNYNEYHKGIVRESGRRIRALKKKSK